MNAGMAGVMIVCREERFKCRKHLHIVFMLRTG